MIDFAAALDLLRSLALPLDPNQSSPSSKVKQECDGHKAMRLLKELGYVEPSSSPPESNDLERCRSRFQSRYSLLALAAQFEDVLDLPLEHTPGARFLGAKLRLSRFRLSSNEKEVVCSGGIGITFSEAFEKCAGEAAEEISTFEWPNDPLVRKRAQETDLAIFNKHRLWFVRGLGLNEDNPAFSQKVVTAKCLHSHCDVVLPYELVLNRQPEMMDVPRQPKRNGVAAGPTRDAATLSALCEVIERDAIGLWWFGGAEGHNLGPFPSAWQDLAKFIRSVRGPCGTRFHWFLDITSNIGIPVIACLSADRNGRAVVAGFSARGVAQHAARSAFLEMCQMELAQEIAIVKHRHLGDATLSGIDRAWLNRLEHLDTRTAPELAGEVVDPARRRWTDFAEDVQSLEEHLCVLKSRGYRALAIDLTRPEIGIPVVRVVIPGLQTTNPDWVSPRLEALASANGTELQSRLRRVAPI